MEIKKDWFTSSHCGANNSCVETRLHADGTVEVRDTKDDGAGPVLSFSADAWAEFLPMLTAV